MRNLLLIQFVFLLVFNISVSAEKSSSGKPNDNSSDQSTLQKIKLPANVPMEKGRFHELKSNLAGNNFTQEERFDPRNNNVEAQPFYLNLQQLSYSDRENAQVEIETADDISQEGLTFIKNIQQLWNFGNYDQAIAGLELFEKENENRIVGVGISWKVPRIVSAPEGVDVQIGARTGVYRVDIDTDASTGNLLAAILFDDGVNRGWTVNISTDDGLSWSETYYWNSGTYILNDVDASIVGGYFWVGHIAATTAQDVARMRRFLTTDGSVDATYGYQTLFDFNIAITDIVVFSNVDNYNNRIYYYAITADDSLRFFWDDMTGTSWTDYSPDISDASHGLDACWNYNNSNAYAFVSYVNTAGMLHVIYRLGGWTDVSVATATTATSDVTSIAAYQDTIITVYEAASSLNYMVSYDEGSSWYSGTVAFGTTFYDPHVTGRKNGGFAVVYSEEAGDFDPVWFVRREYSVAGWSTPLLVNEIDDFTGAINNIEWIPPLSASYAHGGIWIANGSLAYFDRIEDLPPDIYINPTYLSVSLLEGGADTSVVTIYNTASASSSNLIWDITEQVSCSWLSESPANGIIVAGSSENVDVFFDATSLTHGVYACTLLVNSNDPVNPQVAIPVELTVEQLPPDISVSQASYVFTVPENGSDVGSLTISNTAAAGAADLDWNIIDREISLVTKSGKDIPVKVAVKTDYIKGAHAPSIGMAPKEFASTNMQNTNKNNFNELFTPLDFGYGPEYYNQAIGNFTLTNPEYINFGGTYPGAFYAGAEFGNTGNYTIMYCLDYNNYFVSIDIASGVVDTIAVATPYSSESWVGLAMDPTSGTMYAASTDIVNSSLYTIDISTGSVTRLGAITNVAAAIAIAIDNSGQMYGYDIVTDSLFSVNKTTGSGLNIGPLGFDANFGQGMDFDESDGTLYLAAYNNAAGPELRIADPITGTTVLVGPLGSTYPGGNIQVGGFAVGNQSDCPWVSELPTSGSIAPGNNQNVEITVDATGLAVDVYNCELRVISNDPDEPAIIIPIELNVVTAPAIAVTPASVTETVSYGDSVLSPLHIENTGTAELFFNARLTNFKNLVSNPHFTPEQITQFTSSLNQKGAIDKDESDNAERNVDLIKGNSKWFLTEQFVLWDNGPLVNSPGTGANGADESVLQNISLGMSTIGFGHQVSANNRVADDFVVTGDNWTVDQITFFAYQTNSDTNSTITEVNYRVWDGPPGEPGSNVVFGDTSTNRLIGTTWSGIYRITETTAGATNRPVMANFVTGGFSLTPGRYWLDWQSNGSLASGPWAPPITVTGMDSTGDGWQYTSSWAPVVDGGTGQRQGFPFVIEGTADNVWMKLVGPVSGFLAPGGSFDLDLRLFGVIQDSVFDGEVTITSNAVSNSVVTIPVELTVTPPNSIDPKDVGLVTKYELLQNYPNPFNPSTMIKYRLAAMKPQQTTLRIYNSLGQHIRTLVNAEQGNGEYSIVWDGLDANYKEVASGIYYYRIQSGDFVSSQKLIKLK